MDTSEIGSWLLAFLTGLLALWAVHRWGKSLPKKAHFDDLLRSFIAVFCVAGPLAVTPNGQKLASATHTAFVSAVNGFTNDPTKITIIGAVIFVGVCALYTTKLSSTLVFVLVLLVSLPTLLGNEAMMQIVDWWVNNWGSALFRLLIEGLNKLVGF